uniref:Fumarylacetoacetase-like C-terminal domain-containing protein n=1 Tax=Panagrolaimus sp. JU765 TaxID=591449 RepID=A0AC34R863_9BILA
MDLDEVKSNCGNIYGFENVFLEKGSPEKPIFIFKRDVGNLKTEGQQITIPAGHLGVVTEVHLGIIISESGAEIPKEKALDYVAGYTVALNSRLRASEYVLIPKENHIRQTIEFESDVIISSVISKTSLPHPNAAQIWATVNEKKIQESFLTEGRLTIQEIIEKISQIVTLEKGDIVLAGSPPGATYIKSGDLIEFGIEGVIRAECFVRKDAERRASSVDLGSGHEVY